MKLLDFATYIFYRYYDKGSTAVIAYESALMAISLLIFMNVLALLIFIGVDPGQFLPIIEDKGRVVRFISGFLLFIPQYFLLRLILPKKRIKNLNYKNTTLKYGKIGMVFYILISMVLIVIAVKTK